MRKTCYACEDVATTVEHVPAKSFFPVGKRSNLITVPSCQAHNNDLSMDVEYVRNIVPLLLGTNATGLDHLVKKVLPSFSHSPGLAAQTFYDLEEVRYEGLPSGIFTVDLKRLERVMVGVLRALHFRDTSQRHKDWAIIPVSMMHKTSTATSTLETWSLLIGLFNQVQLVERPLQNEEVFKYSSASNGSERVGTFWFYEMTFYGGFTVKGFTIPEPA